MFLFESQNVLRTVLVSYSQGEPWGLKDLQHLLVQDVLELDLTNHCTEQSTTRKLNLVMELGEEYRH